MWLYSYALLLTLVFDLLQMIDVEVDRPEVQRLLTEDRV
jgi:hypothetical protein